MWTFWGENWPAKRTWGYLTRIFLLGILGRFNLPFVILCLYQVNWLFFHLFALQAAERPPYKDGESLQFWFVCVDLWYQVVTACWLMFQCLVLVTLKTCWMESCLAPSIWAPPRSDQTRTPQLTPACPRLRRLWTASRWFWSKMVGNSVL